MVGQARSKWLQDEGDDGWEARIGRDNNLPKSGESSYSKGGKQIIQKYSEGFDFHENRKLAQQTVVEKRNLLNSELVNNSKYLTRPDEEELIGLNII